MRTNVGQCESDWRIAIGAMLIEPTAMEWIGPWGNIGAVLIWTSIVRKCLLYRLLDVEPFHGSTPRDEPPRDRRP